MAEIRQVACHFLVSLSFTVLCLYGIYAADTYPGQCGTIIDMTNIGIHSGVLEVPMPASMARYQDPTLNLNCDIRIMFSSGQQLQIELYHLDIMPVSTDQTVCSTGLEVFERFSGRNIYGGRLCMQGWEWEERHRERKKEKKIVESSPVTFRLISEGPYRGSGFKVHFNLFRANSVCLRQEFRCREVPRCVIDDIACDGWDDCSDDSDEGEDAGCGLLSATEIIAIIVGIILLLETIAIIIVFCLKYRRLARNYKFKSQMSLASSGQNLKPQSEPSLYFPHRANSMESMNKSTYSRRTGTRRDSDSSIDKAELERSDRNLYKDNGSERSYRSRQSRPHSPNHSESRRNGSHYQKRRSRASSPSSITREKVEPSFASLKGSQPDLGTGSERDAPDKDKVYKDNDRDRDRRRSRDRRRDDRYSDSDDRSPPRRRRSRRYDYSSEDEDYDSEYEYERRRRRRRSQDRYSRDRYGSDPEFSDNSDYERERERRRRRSRDRYRRDDPDYDEERDRNRQRRRSSDHVGDRYTPERDSYDEDNYKPRKRKPSQERYRRQDDQEPDSYDDDEYRPRRRKPSQERDRRRDDNEPPSGRRGSSRERARRPEDREREDLPPPPFTDAPNPDRQRGRGGGGGNDYRPQDQWRKPEGQRSRSPATPPRGDDPRIRQNQRSTPAQGTGDDSRGQWKPRTERRKRRQENTAGQGNGSPPPPAYDYEDVQPRIQLENYGYREEAV